MVRPATSQQIYQELTKEIIPCGVCGQKAFFPTIKHHHFGIGIQMVTCQTCGFLFTNPRPTQEELNRYYRQMYRKSDRNPSSTPKNYDRKRKTFDRAYWYCQLAKEKFEHTQNQTPSILDIGCGAGVILYAFKEKFPEARLFGIEPSPSLAQFCAAKTAANVFSGTLEEAWADPDFSKQRYDGIILNHVLEHLLEPVEKLKKIRGWLRPGGWILIQVPCIFHPECSNRLRSVHVAHVNQFSQHTLRLALEKAGFDSIEEKHGKARVLTFMAQSSSRDPISTIKIPSTPLKSFFLSIKTTRLLSKEYYAKNPHLQITRRLGLGLLKSAWHGLQRDLTLNKLIKDQHIVLLGPFSTETILSRCQKPYKIFCSYSSLPALLNFSNKPPIHLFIFLRRWIHKNRLLQFKSLLETSKPHLVVTDNPRYVADPKKWGKIFDPFVQDETFNLFYTHRMPQTILSLFQEKTGSHQAANWRLLEYCLYHQARQISLVGWLSPTASPDLDSESQDIQKLQPLFPQIQLLDAANL